MGVQPKKCTHSSHSEDTSIGLSISEWSTGTNTVRQYANLSASESLSGVSNLSGAKSEKSSGNVTNKSSDFSSNLSGAKSMDNGKMMLQSSNKSSSDNLSYDINKYDKLCNSETHSGSKKHTTNDNSSSGTKSDSTLTLAQSISEWSASTSNTLVPTTIEPLDPNKYTETDSKEKVESQHTSRVHDFSKAKVLERDNSSEHSSNEPVRAKTSMAKRSLDMRYYSQSESDKSSKSEKSSSSPQSSDKKPTPPAVPEKPLCLRGLKAQNGPQFSKSFDRPLKISPKSLSCEERSNKETPSFSQRCQSEDRALVDQYHLASPQGEFSGRAESKLYSQEEKLTQRYQSQDFANFHDNQKVFIPPDYKPLTKHSSYDDKTLSRHQIREYRSSQHYRMKTKSRSFHEHLLLSPEGAGLTPDITQHLTKENVSNLPENLQAIDRANKTPMKLSKCSPYYSSSLSSESPPIQTSKVTTKKSVLVRNLSMKSPPSGNDTDSSLDLMHDPKERIRNYRRRRQVSAKKNKLEKDKYTELKDRESAGMHDLMEEDTPKSQNSSEGDRTSHSEHCQVGRNGSAKGAESSECSEGYIPELESGSSEISKTDYHECQRTMEFEENQEGYDDLYAKIPNLGFDEPYPQLDDQDRRFRDLDDRFSNIAESFNPGFDGFGVSADEDEMGYPRFDRLGRLRHPYLDSENRRDTKVPYPPPPDDRADEVGYRSGGSKRSSVKRKSPKNAFMNSPPHESPSYQMDPSLHYPQEQCMASTSPRRQSLGNEFEDDDDDDTNEDPPYHLDSFVYTTTTIKKAPSKGGKCMFTREDSISAFAGYDSPSDRMGYDEYSNRENYEYGSSNMFKMQEVYPQYNDYDMPQSSNPYYGGNDRRPINFQQDSEEYDDEPRHMSDQESHPVMGHFVSRPNYTSEPSFEGSEHSFDVSTIPPPLLSEEEDEPNDDQ